jgi:hypothetical protein
MFNSISDIWVFQDNLCSTFCIWLLVKMRELVDDFWVFQDNLCSIFCIWLLVKMRELLILFLLWVV